MQKRIMLILYFWLISVSAYCLNLGEIISQVRLLENDNLSTSYRYTDQNIIDRANIIQDEICIKTLCVQSTYYITTSSTTKEYRLPSNCLKILRIAYHIANSTGAFKKLAWTSIAGQDAANNYWENSSAGLPTEYYKRGDYIGLKPYPSSSYSGTNYIKIDYAAKASSMASSTDIPFNGDYTLYSFHSAIIEGIVAMCEWDKGDMATYAIAYQKYRDWLDKIKEIYYTEPDKNTNFTR